MTKAVGWQLIDKAENDLEQTLSFCYTICCRATRREMTPARMLLAKCRVGCQLTVLVSICVVGVLIMAGLNV